MFLLYSFAQKCHPVQCVRDVGESKLGFMQLLEPTRIHFLSETMWYYYMIISSLNFSPNNSISREIWQPKNINPLLWTRKFKNRHRCNPRYKMPFCHLITKFTKYHLILFFSITCRQGTLTPPDTWSRPFGTCICSTCWTQSFFRTCRYFPDSGLRIYRGTFSILLL